MTKSGMTVEFQYDHNGLRTQKKVTQNSVTTITNYMLHGKLVTHMTVGSDKLHFFYDDQQRPAKVSYDGTVYTYLHNLQGDIVGIVDGSGNLVVEYRYDAWGKHLSVSGSKKDTLGKLNPFRYRGYVYDEETGLYYLRSRYYNSDVGRFINLDKIINSNLLLGMNLMAYCCNSVVLHSDSSGMVAEFAPNPQNTVGWSERYGDRVYIDLSDRSLLPKDFGDKTCRTAVAFINSFEGYIGIGVGIDVLPIDVKIGGCDLSYSAKWDLIALRIDAENGIDVGMQIECSGGLAAIYSTQSKTLSLSKSGADWEVPALIGGYGYNEWLSYRSSEIKSSTESTGVVEFINVSWYKGIGGTVSLSFDVLGFTNSVRSIW